MRMVIAFCFAALPAFAAPGGERIIGQGSDLLTRRLQETICSNLRRGETACSVSVESATYHELGDGVSLWALAWRANTNFSRKGESPEPMREALEKQLVQVLDTYPAYFTGIAYFRRQAQSLSQLSSAAFSMVALNTTHKAVARISPDLFLKGDVHYTLPEKWQREGLSATDRGAISLTIPPTQTAFSFSFRNLDDVPLTGIQWESCRLRTGRQESICNPQRLDRLAAPATLTLQLTAGRNLLSTQPAFKLVMQEAESAKVLLHLAVPFRPRPNYLVFGVAGFLCGGLIAVMVLMMRKKSAQHERFL